MPNVGLGIPMGGIHSHLSLALQIKPGPLPAQSESWLQEVAGVGVCWSWMQTLLLHEYPVLQVPQLSVALHSSEIVPQFLP